MSDAADRLLFALSWWGSVEWPRFVSAFDELFQGLDDDQSAQYRRRDAALNLDSLGHCELHFSRGGGRVAVAPPVLATLPLPGLPRAVLCGARSPTTAREALQVSKEFAPDLRIDAVPGDTLVPSRIEVEAESSELLRRFARKLGVTYADYPPALAVAAASGSLKEHLGSRSWRSGPELNWTRWDFDTLAGRFVPGSAARVEPRLTRYEGGFLGRRYLLWHYGEYAETDPFWGRYAMFCLADRAVLVYDDIAMRVCVPRDAPLPRLLARALALCSGEAAVPVDATTSNLATTRFRMYAKVPPDVFNTVASKLMQPEYVPARRRQREV